MLVLLPPSEGKARPEKGESMDLSSLAFAEELGERREELTMRWIRGCVSACRAGGRGLYRCFFQRLELLSLPVKAQRRVLTASALWGFVRPGDRIPYYRFPMKEKLKKGWAAARFLAAGSGGSAPR